MSSQEVTSSNIEENQHIANEPPNEPQNAQQQQLVQQPDNPPPLPDTKSEEDMSERTKLEKFVYGRNQSTLGQRFEDWLELFDMAIGLNGIKEEQLKAYLLLNIGDELLDIYRSKKKPNNADTYKEVRDMLIAHLKPKTVVFTEVMVFRRAMRQQGESISEFAVRLRQLAKNCKFDNVDKEILQQLVVGIGKPEVERKCCLTENLDLAQAIEIAQAIEGLEANLQGLHKPTEKELGGRINFVGENEDEASVSHVQKQQRSGVQRNKPQNRQGNKDHWHKHQDGPKCGNCGRAKHQSKDQCPAQGKTCNKCQKPNHFSNVCRSDLAKPPTQQTSNTQRKPTQAESTNKYGRVSHVTKGQHMLDEAEYADFVRYKKSVEWLHAVRKKTIGRISDGPRRKFQVLGQTIDCLVDTGAPINIIDAHTYERLQPRPKLEHCATKYYPYGDQDKRPIPTLGQFVAQVLYKDTVVNAGFIVVKGNVEQLMSYGTAIALGIIKMDEQEVASVKRAARSTEGRPTTESQTSQEGRRGNNSF